MPDIQTIVSILWRYKKREALSEDELIVMQDWLKESDENQQLFEDLSNEQEWNRQIASAEAKDSSASWARIWQRIAASNSNQVFKERKTITWLRFAAAAAIIIGILWSGWWLMSKRSSQTIRSLAGGSNSYKNDLPPGSSHATLTLASGDVLSLDSIKTGRVEAQGNASLFKQDSGTLSYSKDSAEGLATSKIPYNTLTTPGGGEYHLILPDGSQVWLNAASSLKYPLHFTGRWRTVELSGEAYFEVTKNKEKPFIVHAGNASVRVIGTHFNVNAYTDEASINTTLLEGSVSVSSGKDSTVINPGQEIQLDKKGSLRVIPANTDQVMAWRHKIFWFQDTPFDEIMRQLSRWYNMDVVFKSGISDSFSGILPRDMPASHLFRMLEKGGKVKFSIEGSKVTVSP